MKKVSFYNLNLPGVSIMEYKKSVIKNCKRYKYHREYSAKDYQVRFERVMTKKLQGDSIFFSLRVEFSNIIDSSVKVLYWSYLRFGRNVFLNLLTMNFEPLPKILDDMQDKLDISSLFEDVDVENSEWSLVSNICNSKPSRSEYNTIRDRLIHNGKLNGKIIDLWDANFSRKSIFSQQLSF